MVPALPQLWGDISGLGEGGEWISAETSEPWAEEREGQALLGIHSMSGEEGAEPQDSLRHW